MTTHPDHHRNADNGPVIGPVIGDSTDDALDDLEVGGGMIVDAELVDDDAPTEPLPPVDPLPGKELVPLPATVPVRRAVVTLRTRTLPAVRDAAVATVSSRPVVGAGRAAVTVARSSARHSWFVIAGAGVAHQRWRDTHGAGRYERMMRRAEVAGDHESLLEWESRDVAEKQRRHDRTMDWVRSPAELIKAVGFGLAGLLGLLVLLGIVLAIGNSDIRQVMAPVLAVVILSCGCAGSWPPTALLLLASVTAGFGCWLWQLGRSQVDPPAWAASTTGPTSDNDAGGRDVVPDERAITSALRNLNLPALNRKFKEGWSPRWETPPVYDGKGWRSQLLLPEGVPVEMIVNAKPVLAHNLMRLPVEVWPTEPRTKPGVMDLYVLDQGSMTKPVAPWPLLKDGVADFFKGVPVGVDVLGRPVICRCFGANLGVAGMMGSGKSTLIIDILLGLSLDPLVDIDIYCMAINADYDPFRPRARTMFVSDDPDDVPQVLDRAAHAHVGAVRARAEAVGGGGAEADPQACRGRSDDAAPGGRDRRVPRAVRVRGRCRSRRAG